MVLVVARGLFSLWCGMWGLVLWPGIEPEPAALGVWSLSHWTTGEVPCCGHSYTCVLEDIGTVKSVYLSVSILWTWFIGWVSGFSGDYLLVNCLPSPVFCRFCSFFCNCYCDFLFEPRAIRRVFSVAPRSCAAYGGGCSSCCSCWHHPKRLERVAGLSCEAHQIRIWWRNLDTGLLFLRKTNLSWQWHSW